MRNPCLCLVAGSLGLVACDDGGSATPDAAVDAAPDAKQFMDAPAPVYDFSCFGNSQPTAAAMIDISGTVQRVSGSLFSPSVAASADADVDVCVSQCAGPDKLATMKSAANGAFSFTDVETGGAPLDAYLRAAKTGDRAAYVYPPAPFTASPPTVPAIMFADGFFSLGQSAGKGMLIVALVDCANMPIDDTSNVDISIKQGGTEVTGTTEVDASMFAAELAGAFLVFNVPPGAVTNISALYKSQAFLARDVRIVADATTETLLRPGY
jgi:hypothetical protein